MGGPPRVLIAGIGNVLRADDGFGPAVIQALEAQGGLPEGVRTLEVGIGGIGLVHELMDGWDALVLVDAMDRGGPPGQVWVLEAEVPEVGPEEQRIGGNDLHEVIPERVLILAKALGVLPAFVRLVGCQPEETETFATELTPVVRQALPGALQAIQSILRELGLPEAVKALP
jgi:hydrogenase maturation protease